MYKMDDGWTDGRMDDFRDEVYRRFDDVDKRFDKFEDRFESLEDRFASLQRTLLVSNGAIIAALVGGIAALLATQL
ncbi:MAG TPA: hypothetical protein VFG58_09750 [Solirubrobacterales bacterium]|nr:hypothetical protein [Solirubrobacterales bacterium]